MIEGQSLQAKIERSVSVELIEERVNGKLFSYRLDVVQGNKVENTRKERWTVEEHVVSREDYQEMIDLERLEEIKEARQKDYQRRLANYEFKHTQRVALTKKILKQLIDSIEQKCGRFKQYSLGQYMAYNSATFASEIDFANVPTHYLEPSRQLLLSTNELFSFEKAEEMIALLEGYSPRIQGLFEDTVKKAIAYCDDTHRLKQLLEIVS